MDVKVFNYATSLKFLLLLKITSTNIFPPQNDYLDIYGDQNIKVGFEITNGKIGWAFITAYHQATNAQKKELLKNFGKDDPDAVQAVKNLYDELNLPESYQKTKRERTNYMVELINELPDYTPRKCFHQVIEMFFKNDLNINT